MVSALASRLPWLSIAPFGSPVVPLVKTISARLSFVTAARRAVKRLASLDVNTIVFSHYPPLQEGAMDTLETLARRIE